MTEQQDLYADDNTNLLQAAYLTIDPLNPDIQGAGVVTICEVRSEEEARLMALTNGWELLWIL